MPRMPEFIRFSETFDAPAAEVAAAVKKRALRACAKRRDGLYQTGRHSGAWVKMRVNKGRELVIVGYVPTGKNLDPLIRLLRWRQIFRPKKTT